MASGARRFRRGLPVEPVEVDGYKFFQVQRPGGDTFRLYDFEHQVALALDGRPLDEVARSVRDAHGLDLTELQVMAFVDRLGELDLLEPEDDDEQALNPPSQTAEVPAPLLPGEDGGQELDDEPTAGHGLAALRAAAAALNDRDPEASPGRSPRLSGWQEAEPTALMTGGGFGDLLAESRARTGEANIYPPEGPGPGVAPSAPPDESPAGAVAGWDAHGGPQATQEFLTAAARFDQPLPGTLVNQPPEGGADIPPEDRPGPQPDGGAGPPRRLWLWALVALGVAAAVGYAATRFLAAPRAAPVSVDTVLPSPTSVYRWFETEGHLSPPTAPVLTLAAGGKLIELQPEGTKFEAGDTLALTEEAKRLRKDVDHIKERLAYYQQMFEAMTAEGNRAEARQAELKLREKQERLDEAMAAYAQVALVASSKGVVGRHLAKLGDTVKPGDPVLALEAQQMRAVFTLPPDEAEAAQRLAFCRVTIHDQPHDCSFVGADTADTVIVELPAGVEAPPDAPIRLSRARFDAVFVIPASAVVQVGNSERLFVANAAGQAEVRAVSLADRTEEEVLVAQGLDVGEPVIVDVPPALVPGAPVRVGQRALQ